MHALHFPAWAPCMYCAHHCVCPTRYFGAAGCIFANTTICCSPGPALEPSTTLPNCLIIGDSVSDQCVRPSMIQHLVTLFWPAPCDQPCLSTGLMWSPSHPDLTSPLAAFCAHLLAAMHGLGHSVPPFAFVNISLAALREKQRCDCLQRYAWPDNHSHGSRRSELRAPSPATTPRISCLAAAYVIYACQNQATTAHMTRVCACVSACVCVCACAYFACACMQVHSHCGRAPEDHVPGSTRAMGWGWQCQQRGKRPLQPAALQVAAHRPAARPRSQVGHHHVQLWASRSPQSRSHEP
jgi:hypothetical protein